MSRLTGTYITSAAVVLFALLFFDSPSRAEEQTIDHVNIIVDTKKSRKPPKAKKPKAAYTAGLKFMCEGLGNALTAGQGPWGFGMTGSFGCFQGKKLVTGVKKSARWELLVVDGKKSVVFRLRKVTSAGKFTVAEIKMPPSEYTFQFFEDEEFTDLVAYALLEAVPGGMVVNKASLKGAKQQFSGPHWRAGKAKDFKYEVPQPPENLVLFRLDWDTKSKLWRSEVVGSAKRVEIKAPQAKTEGKTSVLVGGEVLYETTPEVAAELEKGPLWAQNAEGPRAKSAEIAGIIKEAQIDLDAAGKNGTLNGFFKTGKGSLLAKLLDSAASGYVGMRYGLQVLPSEGALGTLLDKTAVFSLLAEVRGGPVKGLRYYYDKLPETKADLETADGTKEPASIAFARHVIGFSMGFDPGFLVDRVTADPKIGMWTFDARLPVELDDDGKVTKMEEFKLGRTFSLALEIGLEYLSSWYTVRGWYAIDTGFSLLKTGGRVTSNRLGIDAYFTAGPTFPIFGVPFKTALLAFYVFEHVNLESGDDEDPEIGEDKITGIEYDAGYAGGGIAISW